MSIKEEESTWFTVAEKFFALLIIILGGLVVFYTTASPGLIFPVFFIAGGLALVVLGVFIILSKTP